MKKIFEVRAARCAETCHKVSTVYMKFQVVTMASLAHTFEFF